MNPIRAAGSRRVDRQISRPGLEHRQNRHDRLDGTGEQQRHTLAGARTTSNQQVRQPVRASSSSRYVTERPPTGQRHRLGRALHVCGEQHRNRHPASPARSTPPGCRSHPAGRAHRHPADPPTTTAAPDRRSSPPTPAPTVSAKSETSKFENGCPAPAVLRKSWSPAPEKINPKPPTRPELVI